MATSRYSCRLYWLYRLSSSVYLLLFYPIIIILLAIVHYYQSVFHYCRLLNSRYLLFLYVIVTSVSTRSVFYSKTSIGIFLLFFFLIPFAVFFYSIRASALDKRHRCLPRNSPILQKRHGGGHRASWLFPLPLL